MGRATLGSGGADTGFAESMHGRRVVVSERALLLQWALDGSRERAVAHRVPAWRMVLGRHGPIDWVADNTPSRGRGLLIPPEVPVDVMASTELLVLHLEAEKVGIGPLVVADVGVVPLVTAPPHRADRLWAAADDHALDTVTRHIVGELQVHRALPAGPLDPRVVAGARALASADGVAAVAEGVGLSRSRFRALMQRQFGASPTRLRSWQRLRRAVAYLSAHGAAEAAVYGGFADQPHLTRTASAFLATTPGRLRVQGPRRPTSPESTMHPGPGARIPASLRA